MRIDLHLSTVSEGTWANVSSQYRAYSSGGVEVEVGEFLYGLVRVLKPNKIFETGTHHGISSAYMGMALKDNNKGKIITVESSLERVEIANTLFADLGLGKFIDIHCEDVRAVELEGYYDLLFLDSEPQYRFNELERFYPHVIAGGYILIHDLHRHLSQEGDKLPFGEIPSKMQFWIEHGDLVPFHLPSPRGLAGFYKPSDKDYHAPSTIR